MQKIVPISAYTAPKSQGFVHFTKRLFDLALSLVMLILLAPVFIVLLLLSALDTKSSPLFIQERCGRNNKPFRMYKFRTMKASAPSDVATYELKDPDQYMSGIGRLLRKLSLDELPQLINILLGDMSFVGPRPVVLTETQLIRMRTRNGANTVRPGLTGLSQVNGRDTVSIYRKARMDAQYAQKMSLRLDLSILLRTVTCVLASNGVEEGCNPNEDVQEARYSV